MNSVTMLELTEYSVCDVCVCVCGVCATALKNIQQDYENLIRKHLRKNVKCLIG